MRSSSHKHEHRHSSHRSRKQRYGTNSTRSRSRSHSPPSNYSQRLPKVSKGGLLFTGSIGATLPRKSEPQTPQPMKKDAEFKVP